MKKNRETATVICCVTGDRAEAPVLAGGKPGLPRGWTLFRDQWYSPEGFEASFDARSQTVPVDRVVLGYKTPFPPDRDDPAYAENYRAFRRACQLSWRQVTQASNWLLFRLAGADTQPLKKEGEKVALPKLAHDSKALYAELRSLYPELDSQSLSTVLQLVPREYGRQRFGVRVVGCPGLRSYRFPQPLPIPEKDSFLELDGEGRVLVRLRISGQQFVARLKSDPRRFGRQLEPLRKAAAGDLLRGACSVRDGNEHQTLISVACYLPKQAIRHTTETFLVRTDPNCLYVGEMRGRNVFVLNECQLKRWEVVALDLKGQVQERQEVPDLKRLCDRHADFVQKINEDRKAERRGKAPYEEGAALGPSSRRHRRNVKRHLETRCDKHRRRVNDALHKIASVIANHAARRRVCTILWDDGVRTYMPSFPYARVEALVREKAGRFRIQVVGKESVIDPNVE